MTIEEYKQQFIELAKQMEKEYGTFQRVTIDAVFAAEITCERPVRYEATIEF